MLYAIQKPNVRFFLSEEEEDHLFGLFNIKDVSIEIVVHGSWNEYLTFKPVVYKSRRSNNPLAGSYAVQNIKTPAGDTVKSIVVPIDTLKISRMTINQVRPSAEILCKRSKHNRELLVYPMQLVEQTITRQDVSDTNTLQNSNDPATTVQESAAVVENKDDRVSETVQPESSAPALEKQMTEQEQILWTTEVVTEINTILRGHKEISALLSDDGRTVKFTRKSIKRRIIV